MSKKTMNLLQKEIEKMKVGPGKNVSLQQYATGYDGKGITKEVAAKLMKQSEEHLQAMQDKLYSYNQHSVLIIIQAMDAAGKDSLVKQVLGGLNPNGVNVHPFRAPTDTELEHDYLWRHNLALPGRGEIGIFVRSHYENVLVTRVHPEYILRENLPGYDRVEKIDKKLFRTRFRQINDWERHLSENGMTIIKLFLYSSLDEQKKQFLERIDDPSKNWKFNMADIAERQYWEDYMDAYEDLLKHTSTKYAPCHIVPADDRWFTRVAASTIIYREFEKLKLKYPEATDEQKKALLGARRQLVDE